MKSSSSANQGGPIYAKHQANNVRFVKEELELLIQQLRNVQRNTNGTTTVNGLTETHLELKKSTDQFVERASKQVPGLVNECPDAELQLRQLHLTIRSQAGGLMEVTGEITPKLGTLSKTFNEYMKLLDKLNASFSLLK